MGEPFVVINITKGFGTSYASMRSSYFTKMFPWKKMSVAYKEWTKKISKGAKREVRKDWKQSEKIKLTKIKKEGIYV